MSQIVKFYKDANSWKINGNSEPAGAYRALYSSGNTEVTIVSAGENPRSLFKRTLITDIVKNSNGDTYADYAEFDKETGSFFLSGSGSTSRIKEVGDITYIWESQSNDTSSPDSKITKIEVVGDETIFTYAQGAYDDVLTLTYE